MIISPETQVDVTPVFYTENYINVIEKYYKAKYILEIGEDFPILYFYQEEPPAGYSKYFGIYITKKKTFILNGDKIKDIILTCVKKGETWIYSHYTHHYNGGNGLDIDGGLSYIRLIGDVGNKSLIKKFKIEDGKLKEIENA